MKRRLAAGILGLSLSVLGVGAGVSVVRTAGAHISLEQGGTHLSRYGDSELKAGPCGRTGGARGSNVYTYAPGATITVSIVEFVSHPSYFRIAFDSDGDGAFKEPASIKPIDPQRKCPDGPGDHCGAADFYNAPSVLPGMDNLNPHLANLGTTPKYTWSVTLPNVECKSCTLQIIQVMQDDAFHGPYDPTPGVGVADIYHQCIDLVLQRGAAMTNGDGGPSSASSSGAAAPPSSGGSGNGNGGGGSGGCSATGRAAGGSFAAALAAAVALLWSRRSRAKSPSR